MGLNTAGGVSNLVAWVEPGETAPNACLHEVPGAGSDTSGRNVNAGSALSGLQSAVEQRMEVVLPATP